MSETGDGFDHLRIPFEKIKFGNKLETLGYGTVFEGEFDDQRVALKQLNITNLANIKPKLLSEILTISLFRQHPNLVALLGFCDEKIKEIILVYEYVASGNLADKMRKRLNTIQRFEICLGAARGLHYLHTGVDSVTIVHGNVKPSKILLNSVASSKKFEAKVSSFGLSKIVPGKTQESYDEVEKPTKESDVYSFGVVLLEVLCGVSELVDTDDYQERHVTELVPKKMAQNKLQKVVHFDIRKEIKPEALETYAKIACQCVVEDPDARPLMAQVVEELEKALRLQGGEVTNIQLRGSGNITVVEDGSKGDGSEEDAKDLTVGERSVDAGEVNGEEVNVIDTTSESSNGEKQTESVPSETHIEDAKIENSNDDQVIERELLHDLKSEKESNIRVVQKEISTIDLETTEETIDDFDSNKESNIIEENKYDKSIEVTTTSESNGDTSTITNQEADESNILKSDIEDGLEHLRIPFEKIKFGQKIDVRGYGTLFEGEFNNQQVALKRLNITNLGNIKPKLLSGILTISRFRKHPNLVALIGFCDENDKEIILIYEYVSGGNLADNMSKHLTTIQRLQICLGAARGVEYLHGGDESVDSKPVIIHGDLKLSKILLNPDSNSSNFDAKVSGFGLPKVFPGHVEISPKSMDPVHAATGKLTKESDVYTFGVLLLEVLCGVPELVDTDDYQERHVTELVPKRLEQNMLRKIVHFDIRNEITTESLETYAKIACQCVMKNPEERPTMSEVVVELEKALRLQVNFILLIVLNYLSDYL
ncbi:uncharacterized protein LOC143538572 [Bidens hawaiensis]|uniref:uncharacterized protein LOC143538572 n=1 Tax=Bidens hawaiensis TaxID=980011 RepID=UPI0040495909